MGWSVAAGLLMRSGEVRCPVSGFRWYVPSGGLVWNLGVIDTTVLLVVGLVVQGGTWTAVHVPHCTGNNAHTNT